LPKSDATLTKVTLEYCNFGNQQGAELLLAAFHTNRSVTDLVMLSVANLEGAALGACLCGLMESMPQLQRLYCYGNHLGAEGFRTIQPTLRPNRTLKQLHLANCGLDDECIHLVADALVGNTTMELLKLLFIDITSAGLDDITRMITSTQLKTIDFHFDSRGIFNNRDATQHFVSALQQEKSSVQKLPWINEYLPVIIRDATYARMKNSLTRNQELNRVALLFVSPPPPPPPRQQQQQQHATSMMMLKISHQAITKFAARLEQVPFSNCFKRVHYCWKSESNDHQRLLFHRTISAAPAVRFYQYHHHYHHHYHHRRRRRPPQLVDNMKKKIPLWLCRKMITTTTTTMVMVIPPLPSSAPLARLSVDVYSIDG
jgi:hypothetical protein